MADKKKKKRRQPVLQRRPAPLLYFFGRMYMNIANRRKFNLTISGEKVKGPALILSNHASNHDYKFIASGAGPCRISFLSTYHWFTFRKLAFWLRRIGAIPKYQFTTDLESMKKIRYVVQQKKGVVFIAPEGTVYSSGHLGYIAPSIAKMIRFLKVPVYATRIQGAGLGNAKWSKYPHRGLVNIDTHLLFTEDDVKTLKPEEIMQRLTEALDYNEFDFAKANNVRVSGNDKAEGFDTMFYKCPACGNEFTIRSHGNDIECSCCKAHATIRDDFTFRWDGEKQYFENYSQWWDWQLETVKALVEDPDFRMESEVDYGIDEPGVDNYIKVGHGTLVLSHSGWDYRGSFKEQEYIEEHDDISQVFLAVLKVGTHIELPYRFDHCRVFYPTNGTESMKWHLASLAMSLKHSSQLPN